MSPGPDGLVWRKAAASRVNGCVEVAKSAVPGWWLIHNSRTPDGATLSFTDEEMQAFIVGVRNGEFDPEMWRP